MLYSEGMEELGPVEQATKRTLEQALLRTSLGRALLEAAGDEVVFGVASSARDLATVDQFLAHGLATVNGVAIDLAREIDDLRGRLRAIEEERG
jgi:hypothetical protein